MKSELFKQFLELAKAGNHEHAERAFVTQNGKMYYQPYGSDYFYRGSNVTDDLEWLKVYMDEEPLELNDLQKGEIVMLGEFVYEF